MKKYWYVFVCIFIVLVSFLIYFNTLSQIQKTIIKERIAGNEITYTIDYNFDTPHVDAKPKIELNVIHKTGNTNCKINESKTTYFNLLKSIAEENEIEDYYFSINCKHQHLFGVNKDGVTEVLTPQY